MLHQRPDRFALALLALTVVLLSAAGVVASDCPPDPPPPECDNDGQFLGGRWDLSQISGSYTVSGDEKFWPYLDDVDVFDDYHVDGTLNVSMDGGSSDNYLEVECDGTVSGQLKQRFTGSIDKTADVWYYDPKYCINSPYDMNWTVTVERTVSVSGTVSGYGQLDLDLTVDTATLDVNGSMAASFDCIFIDGSINVMGFDISGDTENVRMSGGYDPDNGSFAPDITPLSGSPWIDDILHRVKLNGDHSYQPGTITVSPSLDAAAGSQPARQEFNDYLLQTAVTISGSVNAQAEPKTPEVTSLELQEPQQYLTDVPVTTDVVAEIDWHGQPPGTVEFTYGGTTETVAGGDSVTWSFDAGEQGTTIEAVAVSGSERSEPYTINVYKVPVPGWAGSASDWSGSSGVSYEATLDWPVSLEATRTLSTISLFTGLWGISGSASSEFNANANSNGSPGSGDLTTEAEFKLAGNGASFSMDGSNQTTLACDELTTTGEATAQLSGGEWQKTLSPFTLVPGLQPIACGLSSLLCGAVNSIGIKGTAEATLDGTATFTGEGGQIEWDGGSLGGTISGKISVGASIPPPLSSVAGAEIWGGATGCMEFSVAPSFDLTTIGGSLDVGASAWFMGASSTTTHEWPFGDACAKQGGVHSEGSSPGWVPADGQLTMAATRSGGVLTGIAVWTETPAGQVRPSGDIRYRTQIDGIWGPITQLTADTHSDVAPTVDFDADGRAVIVYQKSVEPLPTGQADLPAFANGYELHWAVIDPSSAAQISSGRLTTNTLTDFGPRLRRAADGGLHLFWQRATGTEITGTSSDPVSILVSSWDPALGQWDGETAAADGLEHTFGWSTAALSADDMVIGLIIDSDNDYATDDDRELYQITRSGGTWAPPVQVTSDLTADDSVLAGYPSTGDPLLLWRRNAEVWQLRGDLAGNPIAVFTTASPSTDAGIGIEFSAGAIAADEVGVSVLWSEGIAALLTEHLATDPGFEVPSAPFHTGSSESVHFLRRMGSRLVSGYAVRPFIGDSALDPWVEPRFAELQDPEVFADGFESGDTSEWISTSP